MPRGSFVHLLRVVDCNKNPGDWHSLHKSLEQTLSKEEISSWSTLSGFNFEVRCIPAEASLQQSSQGELSRWPFSDAALSSTPTEAGTAPKLGRICSCKRYALDFGLLWFTRHMHRWDANMKLPRKVLTFKERWINISIKRESGSKSKLRRPPRWPWPSVWHTLIPLSQIIIVDWGW